MPQRRMVGIWERLEGRRLLSGAPVAVQPLATGVSLQLDADGAIIVVNSANGKKVLLPKPTADGSVSILGSDDADTISVDLVTALPAVNTAISQRVYFSTTKGVFGLELGYVADPAKFQSLIDDAAKSLTDAETRQAQDIAQHADATELAKAQNEVTRAQDGVDRIAAIKTVKDETSSYVVYKLDGAYEVYVAMAGEVKDTARIRIDAAGGNDIVAVSTHVPLKASLSGGWGADKLISGKKRSILYGGGGNDRLFSRSQAGATLDGGKGADRYYNRFGEVEIMGRNDGDCVMVDDKPVGVTQAGTFGVKVTVSPFVTSTYPVSISVSYYFFAANDPTKTNLLS